MLERVLNHVDYAALGILSAGIAFSAFTNFYKKANSIRGRVVLSLLLAYFYLRWQLDAVQIPIKTPSFAKCWDRVDFYRATRNVYMEFSCLVLTMFNFAVAKYRGDIEELQEKIKMQ